MQAKKVSIWFSQSEGRIVAMITVNTVMQFMLTGCSCRVSFMACFYLNMALSVDQLLQRYTLTLRNSHHKDIYVEHKELGW